MLGASTESLLREERSRKTWMQSAAATSLAGAAVASLLMVGSFYKVYQTHQLPTVLAAQYSIESPNPDVFRWDHHDEALNARIGYLTVPLDPFDSDSPSIKLRVAMRLAKTQPSPYGVLLNHCGGPGSGVGCMKNAMEGFDSFSIDQRGVGDEAHPRLQCRESFLPAEGKQSYTVSDFSKCPCALPDGMPMIGETWADIDPENETLVTNLFWMGYKWGRHCYFADRFKLQGKNDKTYNFLDYIGTQYLAYDLDAFRQAIGQEKFSIHGWSYGTMVGAVYATVFPQHCHRVVLDGNMPSMPQKPLLAEGGAASMQKTFGRLLINCELAPDECPMKEPQAEYFEIIAALKAGTLTAPSKRGKPFPLSVGMLHGYMQMRLSDNTGAGWGKVEHTLSQLSPRNNNPAEQTKAVKFILDAFCVVKGVPTWYNYDFCAGPGTTMETESAPMGAPYIEQTSILSTDLAGYGLVPDALNYWKTVKARYAAGLSSFTGSAAGNFFWPNTVTPPAPIGSDVPVLIIGNLFDPSTSYTWSQSMNRAFPKGAMITWQGVGHTLPFRGSYDSKDTERCEQHIVRHLTEGVLPPDGFLCRQKDNVPVNSELN